MPTNVVCKHLLEVSIIHTSQLVRKHVKYKIPSDKSRSHKGNIATLRAFVIFIFFNCSLTSQLLFLLSGETGIGKSTLMDTIFNTKFESEPVSHSEPGVRLKARSYELQESNVRLKLTIVDTVGFGDQINKDDRYVY